MAMGPPRAITQPTQPRILIPLVDLVAGLPLDSELLTDDGHLLAVQQPCDKSETLIHHVTLLSRHGPLLGRGKVSPIGRSEVYVMSPEPGGGKLQISTDKAPFRDR